MITLQEIIKDLNKEDLPQEHQNNLDNLLIAVNKLRKMYGKPMRVTSGYRSIADHMRIYADKGIRDIKKIPMKSRHLYGLACDFADPDNNLKDFINSLTPEELQDLGLYFEDFKHTVGWVHVQIVPPASGKRFFIP